MHTCIRTVAVIENMYSMGINNSYTWVLQYLSNL